MDYQWIKISPSVNKGISLINQLDDSKFDQLLRRIVTKLKLQMVEIFTEEEMYKLNKIFNIDQENLILAIKILQYIFKRMLKYIFMPVNLKNDLKILGLNNEKCDSLVKVWSTETRCSVNELDLITSDENKESLKFSWKLNAELSSDYHKKCKMSKAYITLSHEFNGTDIELTHSELYSMYLQFETIQNELDNITI